MGNRALDYLKQNYKELSVETQKAIDKIPILSKELWELCWINYTESFEPLLRRLEEKLQTKFVYRIGEKQQKTICFVFFNWVMRTVFSVFCKSYGKDVGSLLADAVYVELVDATPSEMKSEDSFLRYLESEEDQTNLFLKFGLDVTKIMGTEDVVITVAASSQANIITKSTLAILENNSLFKR